MSAGGAKWERELAYYRRECNELGARLLRLQEEQSQTFREARRSRTVVKLLRETYRLADFAATTRDIGGAMLELVVDNALCDRAALLREEKPGSGHFVMLHAIGLPEASLAGAIHFPDPPAFLYTADHGGDADAAPAADAAPIVAAMGVQYVLWSHDKGSGHALVLGNHAQTNVAKPFERGDQELIESALSIYLDVLYRKHAEAQLHQAKQAAELARDARAAFVAALAGETRGPLNALIDLCLRHTGQAEPLGHRLEDVIRLARQVQSRLDDAAGRGLDQLPFAILEPEWTMVHEIVHGALRAEYAASIKANVEIECRMPSRHVAILVDRRLMGGVIRQLLAAAVRAAPSGGTVRIAACRFSDGGLEMFFGSRGAGSLAVAHSMPERSLDGASWSDGASLEIARRTMQAHGGTLTIESSAFVGTDVRLLLPQRATRDAEFSDVESR